MRRHDWAVLSLIGISALGGLGITSVLFLRWVDSKPYDEAPLGATSLEVRWLPVEGVDAAPLRETPVKVRWLLFGETPTRGFSHASYGLTLVSHTVNGPFLKVDPRTGVEFPTRHRVSKRGFEYSLHDAASLTSKPSG